MNELKVIAHIRTDFPEKFGIPRQSGLVDGLKGRIVFEPEFRNPDFIKGIEEFSYLWLLWEFEGVNRDNINATVRPPRLGGNERRGVFATRSPFRPNPIGLSSVRLLGIEQAVNGPELIVSGIDIRDNTPIFDIKPYLGYVDSHPDAKDGFAGEHANENLKVIFEPEARKKLELLFNEDEIDTISKVLREDPRPHYQGDISRIYGMLYAGTNIRFKVEDKRLIVIDCEK